MQPPEQSTSTSTNQTVLRPTKLNLNSLTAWTDLHPASPRKTVADYLASLPLIPIPISPHKSRQQRKQDREQQENTEEQEDKSSSPAPIRKNNQLFEQQQRKQNQILNNNRRRDRVEEEDEIGLKREDNGNGFAMILHHDDISIPSPIKRKKMKLNQQQQQQQSEEEKEKKVTLVKGLKPRTHQLSSNNNESKIKPKKVIAKPIQEEKKLTNTRILKEIKLIPSIPSSIHSNSDLVIARIDLEISKKQKTLQKELDEEDEILSIESKLPPIPIQKGKKSKSEFVVEIVQKNKSSKVKGNENKEKENAKGKAKVKPLKRGREDDYLSEEDLEQTARLDARRERRRSKALIVKDKTKSSAETGKAAANRLLQSTSNNTSKRKKKEDKDSARDDDDENSEDTIQKREKKKSKSSKATKMKDEIMKQSTRGVEGEEGGEGKKSKNFKLNSRLTLKPPVGLSKVGGIKIGLFNKGLTSGITKIGEASKSKSRALPDLAFSELNFLNRPNRKNHSSSKSSSSSSDNSSSEDNSNSSSNGRMKLPDKDEGKTKDKEEKLKGVRTEVRRQFKPPSLVQTKIVVPEKSSKKSKSSNNVPELPPLRLDITTKSKTTSKPPPNLPSKSKLKSKSKSTEKLSNPIPVAVSSKIKESVKEVEECNDGSSLTPSDHSAYSIVLMEKKLMKLKKMKSKGREEKEIQRPTVLAPTTPSIPQSEVFEEELIQSNAPTQIMLDTSNLWSFPFHQSNPSQPQNQIPTQSSSSLLPNSSFNPNSSRLDLEKTEENQDDLIERMIKACDDGKLDTSSPTDKKAREVGYVDLDLDSILGMNEHVGEGREGEEEDENLDLEERVGVREVYDYTTLLAGDELDESWLDPMIGDGNEDLQLFHQQQQQQHDQELNSASNSDSNSTGLQFNSNMLVNDHQLQPQPQYYDQDNFMQFEEEEEEEEEVEEENEDYSFNNSNFNSFINPNRLFNSGQSLSGTGIFNNAIPVEQVGGAVGGGGRSRDSAEREFSVTMKSHWYKSKP